MNLTVFTFSDVSALGNGERGGSVVECRSERSGVRDLPSPCCVLEQDTLLPESTG